MSETTRILALEGASNFRDLGGHRAADGGRTRRGLVFRSDAPHRLTPADLAVVGRLGLRVVYDLRTDEERRRAPSVLPRDIRREVLMIGGTNGKVREVGEHIVAGRLAEVPDDFLVLVYEGLVEGQAATFGQLLTGLAESDGLPALIHCTHGKDRTGISVALLLSVLRVDEATILDDYELSTAYYTERRMAKLRPKLIKAGIDDDRYLAVFGAPRSAMAMLLARQREQHGSIEGFLVNEAGMAPRVFTELRARLVES